MVGDLLISGEVDALFHAAESRSCLYRAVCARETVGSL